MSMEPVIKTNLELVLKMKDIQAALKTRGIVPSQSNIKRLVNMIKDTPITANSEFFEDVTTDRQILLMYGFNFTKEVISNG